MVNNNPRNNNPLVILRKDSKAERYVTDPLTAHFLGVIASAPTTIEDLVNAMAPIATRDIVLNYIQYFQSLGVIEVTQSPAPATQRTTIPPPHQEAIEDQPLLRTYEGYQIPEEILSEEVDLPRHLKYEVLFLFLYGANLNFYKILNVPPEASDEEVHSAYHRMKTFFDPLQFAGKRLGSYAPRIEIVSKLIEKTKILCDPEKREKYDYITFGKKTASPPEEVGKRAPIRSKDAAHKEDISRTAEAHYARATFLAQKNDFNSIQEALREIREAVSLDPENKEYQYFLQKLEKTHKKNKVEMLLSSLEQSDFALFDGGRLKREISKILDLGEHAADTYLAIAKILMDKGLFTMARKLSHQAKQINASCSAEADAMIKKIDQVLDYYKRSGKIINTQ